jgi:hypothetical protein
MAPTHLRILKVWPDGGAGGSSSGAGSGSGGAAARIVRAGYRRCHLLMACTEHYLKKPLEAAPPGPLKSSVAAPG